MSDIHHFKETVNGGSLIVPAGTAAGSVVNKGGVWAFRLGDFPAYQRLSGSFEFARLNWIKIAFNPKFNMQFNGAVASAGTHSVTGTLITALDQIPLVTFQSTIATSEIWEGDASNDAGVTTAMCYRNDVIDCSYVRGLQGSKENSLYKKQSLTFKPAFYTYLLDTPIFNTAGTAGTPGTYASNSGCFERQIGKWVNINLLEQQVTAGADNIVTNVGPTYYGPLVAMDLNDLPETGEGSLQLFDVRLTYHISFKRLKGV